MNPSPRTPFRALATAFACALCAATAGGQPASPPAPGPSQVVTGTVCRSDAEAGTLDLLTGTGHALRIIHVRLAADVKVKGRGATAVTALAPGAVCRVECSHAGAAVTAYLVEVLEAAPSRSQ
ncbi:MAG TPA: hypothetical protein VGK89_08805 [Candidatus Eisenbacteria bacterium]|jgi:hypothetical protein